jgi:hypothetical protein
MKSKIKKAKKKKRKWRELTFKKEKRLKMEGTYLRKRKKEKHMKKVTTK